MKIMIRHGKGLYNKNVNLTVLGAPYFALSVEPSSLFGRTGFTLPLINIIDIRFVMEADLSPARAASYAWAASLISNRSALLGAACGLRRKQRGIITITYSESRYREEIILEGGSAKETYGKYSKLMQRIKDVRRFRR